MEIVRQTSPYIRKETSTKRMMADVLIALIPVMLFAIYRFQFDFITKAIVASILGVGLEALSFMLTRPKTQTVKERFEQDYTINNVIPPIITALIFVLTLPSKISIYVVIIGTIFAILIGKMIFGGLGKNIFNPAGIGRVFVALAFASLFSGTYTSGLDSISGVTALQGSMTTYTLSDLFFGNIPGSMGEVSALAILIGAAYLLIRRSADFRVMLSGILSFTFMILVAGIAQGFEFSELMHYTLYHVLSGGLLFGLVFMATDPVTSPYTRPGRLIFGLMIGSLVALIRLFGALPEGMVFALVIANAFVALIDYRKWTTNLYTKKFIIGYAITAVVLLLVVFIGMGGF
jgi:electron transport complex protein RnfD